MNIELETTLIFKKVIPLPKCYTWLFSLVKVHGAPWSGVKSPLGSRLRIMTVLEIDVLRAFPFKDWSNAVRRNGVALTFSFLREFLYREF